MSLTQGTVFSGLRSNKYYGIYCYGIVITARCDLANKKVDKIFFLTAVPYRQWLLSRFGAKVVLKTVLNDAETFLNCELKKYGLQWDILKSFTNEEFNKVIVEKEIGISTKEQGKLIKKFEKYCQIKQSLKYGDVRGLLKDNYSGVKGQFQEIISGKNTQFTFLPMGAFESG